jgi:hypothetical protein
MSHCAPLSSAASAANRDRGNVELKAATHFGVIYESAAESGEKIRIMIRIRRKKKGPRAGIID